METTGQACNEPYPRKGIAMRQNTESTVDRRLMRAYLTRKAQEQQRIIDSVPVLSKRYGAAVDELEEIEELLTL